MLGRLRRRWKRPPGPPKDKADMLIWRSTTALSGFRMDVCTRLVAAYFPLSDAEYDKVLERYWRHVSYWNVRYEVIGREMARFARAAGRDPKDAFTKWWIKAGEQIMLEEGFN